jgi:hypothetical protein
MRLGRPGRQANSPDGGLKISAVCLNGYEGKVGSKLVGNCSKNHIRVRGRFLKSGMKVHTVYGQSLIQTLIISLIPFFYVFSYSPVSPYRTTPGHFETFESMEIP